MTSYLVKFSRKRNWDILQFDWLVRGEVQSDPITDLRTKDGKLSVWEIDEDRSNLELVLLALACTRWDLDEIDFGLFNGEVAQELGIAIEHGRANTPVRRANPYHRNLTELTVSRLANFVYAAFPHIEKERRLPGEVTKLILEAWSGEVKQDEVDARLREKIEQAIGTQ